MAGRRRFLTAAGLATAVAFAALLGAPFAADSTPTDVGFTVCPRVTETRNTPAGSGAPAGCGSPVSSSKVFLGSDDKCTPATNTELGTFMTTQNPLGVWGGAKSPDNCTAVPPTRGHVVQGAEFTVSVTQTGACPTQRTIRARTTPFGGPLGNVLFPIGSLRLGTYRVTLDFPDQTVVDPRSGQSTSWRGNHATGTLHVGSTFTETERTALAAAGDAHATLISNSVAGRGAGELLLTRRGSVAALKGTDYFACGTIGIAGSMTLGKRGPSGLARVKGNGTLTGGTGNYEGIRGAFRLTGSYDTKTKRGTLALAGTATFASG